MGAPMPEMEPVENETAEALLSSLKTIAAGERRKHATVFNYWQSIRQDRQFPPIRDLDPLEVSDAGPWSILLEMAGGGDDAVVRHFGQAIRLGIEVEKIGQAPFPSLLSSIHNKLPIVAACRQAFAFEEVFETDDGPAKCWVTLLPFSETGTWIDYVYGFVSLDLPGTETEAAETADGEPEVAEETVEAVAEAVEEPEAADETAEAVEAPEATDETAETVKEPEAAAEIAEAVAEPAEDAFEPFKVPLGRLDDGLDEPGDAAELTEEAVAEPEPEQEPEAEAILEPEAEPEPEPEAELAPEPELEPVEEAFEPVAAAEPEYEPEPNPESKPSFSAKLLDSLATFSGFHGRVVQTGPIVADEMPAEEPVYQIEQPEFVAEVPAAEPDALELVEEAAEYVTEEPVIQPTSTVEGSLHSKLTDVRAKAEEARLAQLACDKALYEGLGAAYDFALDAEHAPEEYLKLVEAQGLKIQLRSPMTPVARLAFDGTCDEASFAQLEAILAWALKQDLPRGSLAERIEAEGGIGQILGQQQRAA